MKRKLSTLLFLTALITCFGVMPAQALNIGFDVLDSNILVGESFDVNVWAEDDMNILGDLTSFGFDVYASTLLSLFTYDGYTVDPDYDDSGYNDDPGLSPSYVGGIYNGSGNAGSSPVYLATLSFTAAVAGTDTLAIEGIFDGWDQGLYYLYGDEDIVSSLDITINPGGAAPVPEPATILLVGTGLIGIIGFSRKRFNKKA